MAGGDGDYRIWTTGNTNNFHTEPGMWNTISTMETNDNYKESFEKTVTIILGSSKIDQEVKDRIINDCMNIKEFRSHVSEYFPQYASKIKLWEVLHADELNIKK
jgi:hypothetical protein